MKKIQNFQEKNSHKKNFSSDDFQSSLTACPVLRATTKGVLGLT